MKILFVLEYYLPHIGGVEIVFKNLCEGLVKRGHNVKVITSRISGTQKKETLNGVEIERVNVPKILTRYLFSFLATRKVAQEAKNYDLVHTTTFTASRPASIGAKKAGKKVILTVHEVWIGKWNLVTEKRGVSIWIHNTLEKGIYKQKFDKYICVSNATKKDLLNVKNIPKEKVMTIHNGMDYAPWDPKKYDKSLWRKKLNIETNYVLFASGRPGTSKGFEYLINALPEIKKEIKNVKLVLRLSKAKAYTKQYDKLMNMIEKLKLKENIIILEPAKYEELPSQVMMADCVVIPSLAEGFGYTCVEACSLGKAVVATNAGSLPEVINGKGKLVEPGNANAITKGVVDVYQGKLTEFGTKTFLWKDIIEEYEKVYRELLNE
ncbi:glycosyltransferase family 4 protein [Candidatus Woesearchaeota archaeon]|jgi:D-inositol-3-phosphate glycosyltransferase|nr:glycosyltransferase family 4 protein [Candidatus Woesearchaeota archaeon]MBT4368860.1 glycosyltransferase family 4 protein [Candidatus Woesearchaeota archaeon]MBT4712149.1 glycosyltransferase family 4 protein [Candidatus Woesearchaeota archaeon]MBT6639103.1 glycosyltransferase family 4 protein [Candidatus Woesearchaeota archaeon]MBT7134303.1 glycosyltransferase family 4 protein [Candidatus Woesearchaeota archaeon]